MTAWPALGRMRWTCYLMSPGPITEWKASLKVELILHLRHSLQVAGMIKLSTLLFYTRSIQFAGPGYGRFACSGQTLDPTSTEWPAWLSRLFKTQAGTKNKWAPFFLLWGGNWCTGGDLPSMAGRRLPTEASGAGFDPSRNTRIGPNGAGRAHTLALSAGARLAAGRCYSTRSQTYCWWASLAHRH